MPQGAALYDLLISYLCPSDALIVQKLAEQVLQANKLSLTTQEQEPFYG